MCNMNKSGVSHDEKVRFATALMNKRTVAHSLDDLGPAVNFFKA